MEGLDVDVAYGKHFAVAWGLGDLVAVLTADDRHLIRFELEIKVSRDVDVLVALETLPPQHFHRHGHGDCVMLVMFDGTIRFSSLVSVDDAVEFDAAVDSLLQRR